MRQLTILTAAAILCVACVTAPAQRSRHRRHADSGSSVQAAAPKQYNQFVTVDEFVKARRAPKMAVSVEGYVVAGFRSDSGVKLLLTDNVDHVMNTRDANRVGRSGAACTLPSSFVSKRSGCAWSGKGVQRVVMYTGAGVPQKQLHDTVAKVRVTGWTSAGRGTIGPVTNLELTDENGDWKKM